MINLFDQVADGLGEEGKVGDLALDGGQFIENGPEQSLELSGLVGDERFNALDETLSFLDETVKLSM